MSISTALSQFVVENPVGRLFIAPVARLAAEREIAVREAELSRQDTDLSRVAFEDLAAKERDRHRDFRSASLRARAWQWAVDTGLRCHIRENERLVISAKLFAARHQPNVVADSALATDSPERETREKFFARITKLRVLPQQDFARIELAYLSAKYLHRAQTRKELGPDGKPLRYFEHVRRAALIAIDELGFSDPLLIMALLLHDSVEDRSEEMNWDMIATIGGDELVRILKLLTKDGTDGYVERLKTHGDWRALFAKGCDRLDNLRSLSAFTPAKQAIQIQETKEKYYPVFERLLEIAPPEHRDKALRLVAMIHATVAKIESHSLAKIEKN